MAVLSIDLGGTKLASALFSQAGPAGSVTYHPLEKRSGKAVGEMISGCILSRMRETDITAIGVAVPGISRRETGTVWAPNIPGWDDYPLLREIREVCGDIPVFIEGDRACYIMGEAWQGNAKGCSDAVFLAVGTGIGAGILSDGRVLRGAADIAGAIGWLALDRPYKTDYNASGCLESQASGEGIAKVAERLIEEDAAYQGMLAKEGITAGDVMEAFERNDRIAIQVFNQCIELWGMTVANLVSLFNPQKIIFGGGVFGPAVRFLPAIRTEAAKWAQPVSMGQVKLEAAGLGNLAGLYGAACIAMHGAADKGTV
ncbi:ROK family protein [Chitinophaga barathri]|uniref:ROK family protein n=1 Tax=Chitinophaga barathri TaxID=1647451 RepID=A0A3N4MG72_9BACT|nr:ROK family protein [Chitinophaga barathri]RPD40697.1 ROK family protein [Chitinophaga barathri]